MTIQSYKDLVDLLVNSIYRVWLMLRGMGVWWYAWVTIIFIMPWFKKLIRSLRGK